MKKTFVVVMILSFAFLYWQCSNNVSDEQKNSHVVRARAADTLCTGEDLFPIHRPSNAEPDSGQECQFYKWAWQTFLYVTQADSTGLPRFLAYETPSELFGRSATPLFQHPVARKELLLAPRLTEDTVVTGFSDVMQATLKGILIDKDGRAIYYAQYINDTFANFVRSNGYTQMDKLLAADSNQTFPRGSLELKSSWKIVMPGDDTTGFFTTKAMVAQFETMPNGKTVINPKNVKEVTVALIGLHVVGVVEGHPEFIWATFEHDGLAPQNPDRNGQVINRPLDRDPTHHYLFYNTGDSAQNCNKNNPIQNLVFVDQVKQTFKNVSSVYHLYWFDDDDQIAPLDSTVRKILIDSTSIWANYTFKGAVWLNDPKHQFQAGRTFNTRELADSNIFGGERELSNVTMETFTQPRFRCFSCHNTDNAFSDVTAGLTFPGKKIGISHVLTNAYFNSKIASMQKNKASVHKP